MHDLFGQLTPNDDPPAVVYNPNVDFRNGKEYVVDLTVLDKNNLALVLIEVILMDNFDDGVFNMACHRLSIVESIYLVICQQVNAMLNNANAGLKIRKVAIIYLFKNCNFNYIDRPYFYQILPKALHFQVASVNR